MDNITTEVIAGTTDVQKLIHLYIKTLGINYNTPFDVIIASLKHNFGLEVTKDDLLVYFEPTLEEFTEDLVLQMNNIR
jgi:hypothetical protein